MFHVDRERAPRGQSQLPEKRRERKPAGRLGLALPWSFPSWNGCCPASHFQILCTTQASLLPVNILLTLSGVEFLLLSVEIILPNTARILPVLCQAFGICTCCSHCLECSLEPSWLPPFLSSSLGSNISFLVRFPLAILSELCSAVLTTHPLSISTITRILLNDLIDYLSLQVGGR